MLIPFALCHLVDCVASTLIIVIFCIFLASCQMNGVFVLILGKASWKDYVIFPEES